jgi:uncharacterized membrane protein YeaQ/YmgE (transglycosylase-associated protein family)
MDFLGFVLTGLTVGWLARQFMADKGFGVAGDLIAGVMGALIGGSLIEQTGFLGESGLIGSLFVAIIGAVTFLYGVRMVKTG